MNLATVYRLREEIERRFPSLGKWQVIGLALACIGLILEQECGIGRIAEGVLSFGKRETVKQRLKRWLKNERIHVQTACYDWMRWVWTGWTIARPILLVDETKLGERLGVMMVSLAYEGRAIPLLWRCYYANNAQQYPQQGQVLLVYGLLAHVLSQLPAQVRPLVQMDRGLAHSSAMLRALKNLKVDFLVRVKQTARFTTRRGSSGLLSQVVKRGESGRLDGWLFGRDHTVKGSVTLLWETHQEEPWCLFSNDPHLSGHRYALRWWQEASFKDLKSGGWQWQGSHITCPERMERLLLVMAIAYGWMLSLGAVVRDLPAARCKSVFSPDELHRYSLFRLGLRWFKHLAAAAPHQLQMVLSFAPPALRHCT
jgi:hypothetical protein